MINESELDKVFDILSSEYAFVCDNEKAFTDRFCKDCESGFISISFTGTSVNYDYINKQGENISDFISVSQYISWRKGILK
jgi:hypothetical protein